MNPYESKKRRPAKKYITLAMSLCHEKWESGHTGTSNK